MPLEPTWMLTGLSMTGAVLNMARRRSGQGVWIFANIGWIGAFYRVGNWPAVALFCFYLATSVVGFIIWNRGDRECAPKSGMPRRLPRETFEAQPTATGGNP
ncbi:MAG: nicotinamide mononucleotide transporter family protein [Desulfobulbaceae bacterium]|nr:nicotinamide mononucleotide transporter family protein [Desulfobulbaceae bacterium]